MAIPLLRRIKMVLFAGDVVSPENGEIWYNTATDKFRGQQGNVTIDLVGASGGGGGLTGGQALALSNNIFMN